MTFLKNFEKKRLINCNSKIISYGTYLPQERVKSDHLFEEINSDSQYGVPVNWMSSNMGIIERRVADANLKPSDVAIFAAKKAISKLEGIDPQEIDLVIFCGIERDQPEPATAHTVNDKLGLNAKSVFDMANACLGFVDGLSVASKFVESGAARLALVVTGEVSSRVMFDTVEQLKSGVSKRVFDNKVGCLSVGDAGGAVILGATHIHNAGFQLFNTDVDSKHRDKCVYHHTKNGIDAQMLMGKILAQGIKMHRNLIKDTLGGLGWDQFDHVLSHQTGKRNFDEFSKFSGVELDKMVKTYPMLGNTTTATFALGWEKLNKSGNVKVGDRIGGLFAGSGLATCQFGLYF